MSAFQHLAGYPYPSAGSTPLTPTQQLLLPASTTSSSTPCCETGRPIMTDPLTGQTVCSCQYTPSLMSYPRLASLPESVYNSYAAQGLVPLGTDTSAFYSALGAPYDLKDGADALRSLAQPGPYYTYDPTLAGYPYGYGMDLNSAARRKNATRENTNTLKAWLYEHRKNPYPTKGEKIMLAIITKMTLTQVSTWFANARRRLKKENKMTWSPKNKADDDDDDDDDDKADHDNEDNGNGSDGDFRDKDRDTDSVIGLGEESEDEIIDAGMESDALPHHLLGRPTFSLHRPSNILDRPPSRPSRSPSPLSGPPRHSRSPTTTTHTPAHSQPSTPPASPSLRGRSSSSQPPSPSHGNEEEDLSIDVCNEDAREIKSSDTKMSETPDNRLSGVSAARVPGSPLSREPHPRGPVDISRNDNVPTSKDVSKALRGSNNVSDRDTIVKETKDGLTSTSESAVTPKPRIWSLADVATSGLSHPTGRRTPPPALPLHLAAHKAHGQAGPYPGHMNGLRLPWVTVSGAFISSGHPHGGHPAGLAHPYVLAPHAMVPRSVSSGVMAPTPTHSHAVTPGSTHGDHSRPHPYGRPPVSLRPVVTIPGHDSRPVNGLRPAHTVDRVKDGLDPKRFGGESKPLPVPREYEETAFKPVSKRPIL